MMAGEVPTPNLSRGNGAIVPMERWGRAIIDNGQIRVECGDNDCGVVRIDCMANCETSQAGDGVALGEL